MVKRALLVCGFLSSLLYVGIDLFGGLSWEGYSYSSQTISEMTAVDAPSRPLLTPLYLVYTFLLIAFAAGVRSSAGKSKELRLASTLLGAVGLIGLAQPFFPMHMRGTEESFTDIAHITLGGVDVLLLVLAMARGGRAFGRRFRLYSVATIVAMLALGAWTALLAPAIPAGLPTPWLGVIERLLFASFLLWIAVLAVVLLRSDPARLRDIP